MAEYSNASLQTVASRDAVIYTDAPVPCTKGFVKHRDGSGEFLLSGQSAPYYGCPCGYRDSVNYTVTFGANIAVPETGTAGEISLGLALGSSILPDSIVSVTPTAVNAFNGVSKSINVPVWKGCCQYLSVVNVSSQAINVQNANIIITR